MSGAVSEDNEPTQRLEEAKAASVATEKEWLLPVGEQR